MQQQQRLYNINEVAFGRRAATFHRHRRLAVEEFLSSSTFHGLAHLNLNSGNKRMLILWSCIVVSAISCLALHVYQQVSEFHKYPLQSSTREILNDFHFPSVTICEAWQMRFFRSEETISSRRRLHDFLNLTYWLFQLPRSENVLQYLPNATEMGVRIHDLLIDCKFNGAPCSAEHFTQFYHRQYGNCFTFQPPSQKPHRDLPEHQSHQHPQLRVQDGLSLILYSPSSDPFFRNHSDPNPLDCSADTGLEIDGVLVTAHEVNTAPRISEDSIIAATSHETKIGLKEVRSSLQNTPQRPCVPPSVFQVYDHLTGKRRTFKTTQADRLEWKETQQVFSSCSCVTDSPFGVPTHLMNFSVGELHYCADLFNSLQGQLEDFREFKENACDIARADRVNCQKKLLRNFATLRRNWESYLCYKKRTNNSIGSASLMQAHDQCNSTGYQFQIFTSELPDSESASYTKGRFDARLIFQTFSRILDRYLKEFADSKLRFNQLPAVVRSVLARDIHPSNCSSMQRMQFPNETHCSIVQEFISRHFLRVQVYPFSVSVVHIAEEFSYSIVDLLSHLGGILGLWIGSSVISLFEMLELIGILLGSEVSFGLNQRLKRSAKILRFPAPRR